MDCLFCKIIKGEIPSFTVYEDDIVKAFLDINPSTNGHTLIIPKKHYENAYDIDDDTYLHIFSVAKKLANKYKKELNCEGITFIQNNELGQDIKHYHLHMLPRYKEDNLHQASNNNILMEPTEIYDKLKK